MTAIMAKLKHSTLSEKELQHVNTQQEKNVPVTSADKQMGQPTFWFALCDVVGEVQYGVLGFVKAAQP